MEDKLKKLFDYQCFERNEKLEKLIGEAESRFARELSDEELTYVNAAGDEAMTAQPKISGLGGRSADPIGSGGDGGGGGAGGGSGAAMSG